LFNMIITNEEFRKYEAVRVSGVCNMFNTSYVQQESGLTKEKILEIMENYNKYRNQFISKQMQQMEKGLSK